MMSHRIPILCLAVLVLLQDVSGSEPGKVPTDLLDCNAYLLKSKELLADEPAEALALARHVSAFAKTHGIADLELRSLRSMAEAELRMGMHMEFMRTSLTSLDIAKELGDPRHIAISLRDVSTAYRMNLRMDQAITEAKRSLAMLLPLNDAPAMAEAQQFLMATLIKGGAHSEALTTSTQALDLCTQMDDELCKARVHHLIAQVLIAMTKFGDALPILTKAERVLKENGSGSEQFQLAVDRSKAMIGLGLTHYARISAEEARELLPLVNDPKNTAAWLHLQYELALAMGNWETALGHLQKIKAQSDSLEIARVDMKMAGLQVMHEMKVKEQDNALLRDLNAQQAETIAGQRASNRYLLILLCGVIILAVALFITSRYALRMMKRLARKNLVIRRQHDEIQAKVLELKRQNIRLAESLMSEEEKELILKEIHHRVKNNLQVVDSLLNIQSNDVDDPKTQRLLKDAQGRIRSMAMVHEHIYRSSGDLHASLRSHIEKLARSILVAHGMHDRISINVDSGLPTFPVETLLPLSLVVNELITNSLKHAFAGQDGGSIRIAIKQQDGGYELRYSDDGVGIAHVAGARGSGSFGHELIGILAHQLNGRVQLTEGAGTVLSMTFIPDKDMLRMAG